MQKNPNAKTTPRTRYVKRKRRIGHPPPVRSILPCLPRSGRKCAPLAVFVLADGRVTFVPVLGRPTDGRRPSEFTFEKARTAVRRSLHDGPVAKRPYDWVPWKVQPWGFCISPEAQVQSTPSTPSTGSSSPRWAGGFVPDMPSAKAWTHSQTSFDKPTFLFRRLNGRGRVWRSVGSTRFRGSR